LFGGIDTKKYVGDLTRVNVLKDPQADAYLAFTVALTSLAVSSSSGSDTLTSSEFPLHAVLDSGTTYTYLPDDLAQQVWNEVGAVYVSSEGGSRINNALIPCSRAGNQGKFTFGFGGPGGPQIAVALDELVVDPTGGDPPLFTSTRYEGQAMCIFGIQNITGPTYLLGDSFLRSAYVVYDLVNNQIALAATDFNATESNLVPFPSFGAQIPSATPAPNQGQGSPTGTSPPGFSASGGLQNAAGRATPLGWQALAVASVATLFVAVGSSVILVM
jgi:hypothetical protein